jgi:exodeoxyribonuclease V beta subunit
VLSGPFEQAYEPRSPVSKTLQHRRSERSFHHQCRTSSYSELISSKKRRDPVDETAKDHDENARLAVGEELFEESRSEAEEALVPLRDFSRTGVAGTCFHAMYEELDFKVDGQVGLRGVVQAKLEEFGYDSDLWLDRVSTAIRESLCTPLDGANPDRMLAKISRRSRLDEMPFLFPVASPRGNLASPLVTPSRLAQVFERYAEQVEEKEYALRLRALGFDPLRGFLKGFVDLVFEDEGQWYVVDYKSNYLGDRFSNYRNTRLPEAMRRHHYVLQYHLYVVALQRYLRYRILDYDYERHFGGVYYLFIKGMSQRTGPNCGIFHDRPRRELIDGIDALFGHAGAKGESR